MRQQKNLNVVLALLCVLIFSSCGNIEVKNTEWCADMGPMGATCFNTLNNGRRDIPFNEWEDERFGNLCTTPKDFAEIRRVIEKLCKSTSKCTYSDEKKIKQFFINVDRVELERKYYLGK